MSQPRSILGTAALLACVACGSAQEAARTANDEARRSELGVFMKTEMNPPFSKLSFLLFHRDPDQELDPKMLPATAGQLAHASARLASWVDAPVESEQGKSVFYDYAESLKADVASLESALRVDRKDGAVRAFEALRKKCDSCHHFFRFDEPTRAKESR